MNPEVTIAIGERQTSTSVKETQRFVGFYGSTAVLRVHASFPDGEEANGIRAIHE